jgi:LuxR family quorum sensing-dependent transcriptional regulator
LNGWSVEWANHYMASEYYRDDPVAAHCRRTINPFEWSEAPFDAEFNPRAAEVMHTAEDFGLKKGFLVPILRSSGFQACVTMAGERPDYDPEAKRAIHLLSLFAHARVTLLLNEAAAPAEVYEGLSDREREVLTWIAAGKSSWDIARILGITERTVNWTIGRAMRKLDAVNRTQAVVNAIRSGAIRI